MHRGDITMIKIKAVKVIVQDVNLHLREKTSDRDNLREFDIVTEQGYCVGLAYGIPFNNNERGWHIRVQKIDGAYHFNSGSIFLDDKDNVCNY